MPSVTSAGLGSGLDVNSIISQLMLIEKQPLNTLAKEQSTVNAQISSYGKIQGNLATLRDKAAAFNTSTLWGNTSTSLSDATVATVTAVAGKNGVAGSHSLQVSALATGQTVSSSVMASSTSELSEGTLTIELGKWTGGIPATGFTAKSGASPVTVSIGAGETSLSRIRDKINAAGAGVTASIVSDAAGARLSIRSAATGEENAFRITATETADDGNAATGLTALGYNAMGSSSMARNQTAGNAQALVDGIAISSTTNTLDQVVEGLSIKLNKVTTGAVDMTVVANHDGIKTAIKDFVSAYNTLNGSISYETKYDATTKVAGALQADRTSLSVQSKMRTLLSETFTGTGSGTLNSLSSIGLTRDSSGNLVLKESKLDDALANPDQVKALLSGGDGLSTPTTGFMTRFRKFADDIQSTNGPLDSRKSGLQSQLKRISDRQATMETHYAATEARLKKQYERLDTKMSGISALSSSVNLMISNMYR